MCGLESVYRVLGRFQVAIWFEYVLAMSASARHGRHIRNHRRYCVSTSNGYSGLEPRLRGCLVIRPPTVDREGLPCDEVASGAGKELAAGRDVIWCPSVLKGLERLEILERLRGIIALFHLMFRSNGARNDAVDSDAVAAL